MRNWSIFIGRILGVELRLHLTFLFLLLFLLVFESNRLGPRLSAWSVSRSIILTGLVFLAVLLHELMHIVVARSVGALTPGVVLLPIGGVVIADPNMLLDNAKNLGREAKIALAGPLFNGIIACVTGFVLWYARPGMSLWSNPVVSVASLSKSFFWINLFLFGFNLLPAFPLDAGRVLRAWLAQRMDFRQASRRAVNIGLLCSALIMLLGVLSSQLLGAMTSQLLMLVGLFLFMAAQMEERTVIFQSVVEAVHMEDVMLTHFSTLSPADTLEDALNLAVHTLQDDFPVLSGEGLVGVINRHMIVERLRREGNGYVQAAMNKTFEIASRTESLASAFRKLTSRNLTLIPVIDEERLIGIVTLQNLMHSMGLLAESRRLRRQQESQI